jgi:hypothetical protein
MILSAHTNINLKLPTKCIQELLLVDDYYELKYSKTSSGHAFRSYTNSCKDAYNLRNKTAYMRTNSWDRIPITTHWLTNNLCDEYNLGMVCLQKLSAGGSVKWHSHGSYDMSIVHFSLVTNPLDMSEVRDKENIDAMNYPKGDGYIFNSIMEHRSTNFSEHDRIHLVVECKNETIHIR